MAGGSARIPKTTCRKCNRTVYVVEIDGVRIELDPELICVVPFVDERAPTKLLARRVHAELCTSYQLENDRRLARAKLRSSTRADLGGGKARRG